MKAIVCEKYGPPEVLRLAEVEKPVPRPDQVLVRVHAAGASISDCVVRSGRVRAAIWLPFRMYVGFRRPRHPILGAELSGEVEAVGSRVTRFRPGDPIFAFTARRFGAYAEYVCLPEKNGQSIPWHCVTAAKPSNISHAEASTAPSRGTLALYLIERASIRSGQKALIYGGSSGIGTFAVQLAKNAGAEVTAVCSTTNLDLLRSLGADQVLDYTVDDGSPVGGPYDIFFDAVGGRRTSPMKSRCQAAVAPGGTSVSVDSSVKIPAAYLDRLKDLIAAGSIGPVVDRAYPLGEAAEAHRYVERGHKRGGVAITVSPTNARPTGGARPS